MKNFNAMNINYNNNNNKMQLWPLIIIYDVKN